MEIDLFDILIKTSISSIILLANVYIAFIYIYIYEFNLTLNGIL